MYIDNNGQEMTNLKDLVPTAELILSGSQPTNESYYHTEIVNISQGQAESLYNGNGYLMLDAPENSQVIHDFNVKLLLGYSNELSKNLEYYVNYNFNSTTGNYWQLTFTVSNNYNNYKYSFTNANQFFVANGLRVKLVALYQLNNDGSVKGVGYFPIFNPYRISDGWNTYRQYTTMPYNIGMIFNDDITNNNIFVDREFDASSNTDINGGYGLGHMPTDNINIPTLPVINMTDTGATLYSLTPLQMKQFRSWLWTTDWVENLKKIRTDPMQNIIGISIIDIPIPQGLNGLIYVGNVSSTVSANVVSNSFIELDCGEITLDEYYGSFADYEPFIATTLYLPKVGFVQIPADACVNNTIKVVYHIELSSGEGLCYVQLTSKRDGFTYIWNTYTCHITSNITLSAQDHSQQLVALGNAIINTGISASNATSFAQGLTNTLSSCIDVAATKNPTSTKGNVGNMSAIMCYKKPYLLINRTNLTKPSSFQENNGYLINYTAKINEHTGFLKTKDFHAEFNAPYNHKVEIERIMNEGVFING